MRWRSGPLRVDADGDFVFIDRLKDSVRRRRENISSAEVECEVLEYPGVGEAAVVPVPAAVSEDEILCVVVPRPGCTVAPVELLRFLERRLAHFMLPRYVRIVDALPKTSTQKVEKYLLRSVGVTADTWDRVAAGVVVRRTELKMPNG